MRLIAGDVGGTKTLLRCVEGDGAVSHDARYESAEWATFDALLGEFLTGVPGAVDAACFAVAGPVFGDRATVTNVGWTIDASSLPIPRVSLINDFHGVALGVPLLGAGDLVSLNAGTRGVTAPVAILGAGTGLGEAFIIGGEVVATEGGHADFAPQDEEQTELFRYLHARHGHVSWERVVSGMGLVNIFTFLGGEELDAAEIALRADRGDSRAQHAFAMFVDMYGAEAGNMALKVLARGGVYLAGGIVAKNVARFTDGKFVEAFVRKGRFRELMEGIPVDLVVNEEVGLLGAVEGARRVAR
ncbi:MAG TPA: glucokinase [Thermoanaerobaculia bacterium]|nr:glucokinase [Thermoanaerobaculia bacterium]